MQAVVCGQVSGRRQKYSLGVIGVLERLRLPLEVTEASCHCGELGDVCATIGKALVGICMWRHCIVHLHARIRDVSCGNVPWAVDVLELFCGTVVKMLSVR